MRWLAATVSGDEVAEAAVGLIDAPPADRSQTLRQRRPDAAAEILLAMLGMDDLGEGVSQGDETPASELPAGANSTPANRALNAEPWKQVSTSQ